MKKRNLLTKILSVICICSLLSASLINGPAFVSEAAGETEQVKPEALGYERITLDGFGAPTGLITGSFNALYLNADSLNEKYLDVDVIVPEGGTGFKIHYGTTANGAWNGILLEFGTESMNVHLLHPGSGADYVSPLSITYGSVDAQVGEKFNFKIATNVSTTETTVDVWVNNIRQNSMSVADASVVGTGILFRGDAAGITLTTPDVVVVEEYTKEDYAEYRSPKKSNTPESLGYEKITLEDFGITSGQMFDSRYGSYAEATTLNGKYLDVDVLIPEDGTDAYFNYAGGGANVYWVGLQFQFGAEKMNLQLYQTTGFSNWAEIAYSSVNATAGEKMNLKIATNVTETGMDIDLWVNDIRQERMTFTGDTAQMGNWLGIWGNTKGITLTTPTFMPEDLGYERLTLEGFDGVLPGFISQSFSAEYADANSVSGKYLDMDVLVPVGGTGTVIHYGTVGLGAWNGLKLTFGAESMSVQPLNAGSGLAYGAPLNIAYSSVDAKAGEKFNFKIATNVSDTETTIDVWVNNIRQERIVLAGTVVGSGILFISDATGITLTNPIVATEGYIYLAPEKEGYVFAGWYVDEACTVPYAEATAEQNVYAKFVPKKVLSVKSQITANLTAESDEGDIRFLTTVDSDDYEKVGFDITIDGFGKETIASTSIYKKLYYINSQTQVDEETTPDKEFSNLSKYFMAYAYWQVPNDYFDTTFTVTPWWITADGTLVYGDTVTRTVNEGIQLYAQQ